MVQRRVDARRSLGDGDGLSFPGVDPGWGDGGGGRTVLRNAAEDLEEHHHHTSIKILVTYQHQDTGN